jgi:SH3-like domain-containing protein
VLPLRSACLGATFGLALWSLAAGALEFRSVGPQAAVLYDAPSTKAQKLFILSQGYPVEILVSLEDWFKVRDASGALAWIEGKDLSVTRMVMVRVPRAEIRQAPAEDAPTVFQAEQDVLLEFIGLAGGYAQVRHRDGMAGYIRVGHIWGL